MGSPQYGELMLDGEPIAKDIEYESLVWSDDRRLLAGQQLVSWGKGPRTCVVVIDAERRIEVVASPPPRDCATQFGSRMRSWCIGGGTTSETTGSCGFRLLDSSDRKAGGR